MKKTIRFFAIAAGFAVVAACNKEQDIVEVPAFVEENTPAPASYDPDKYLTGFGADMEETKADLAEDSGAFSWSNGDQVKVIRSDGQEALYAFNGTDFEAVAEPLEKNGEDMHVFFPALNFVWDTDHVQFTMPASFESLTDIMNPMAAVIPASATAETEIELKNLGAIYEIRAYTDNAQGETLTKVELGNANVYITGSAAVSFSEGIPSIGALNGSKFVTHELASPVTLTSEPKSFYFFLPVTGENEFDGMTVKLVYGKTVGSIQYEPYEFKTRNSAMTVTRSMRKHMNFKAAGFFSGGDGSETNPYLIATAADFKAIKTKMESTFPTEGGVSGEGTFFGSTAVYYKQTADIDFESNDITDNMIGTSAVPFKGTYDGNGKKLQNVSISATADFAGVFGYVNGGDEASGRGVKNLSVTGSISSSEAAVGGIVGRLQSGTISGCVNSAEVTGKRLVGGVVGFMYDGKVSACRNNASVEGTGNTDSDGEIGGIVGSLRGGTMVDCYSTQGVTIKGLKRVGGLAGYFSNQGNGAALIVNCASASHVLSTQGATNNYGVAGGLVGYMYATADENKTVVLANSVALSSSICNTGSASAYLGAIVGLMNGASGSEGNILVRNCYSQHNSATGSSVYYSSSPDGSTITNTKQTNMGAIYGKRSIGNVKDCYCAGNNTGGYGITNASANVYVGVGATSGAGSVANCRAVHNDVINGSGTNNSVSYTSGTINFNGIALKDNSPLVGLTSFMNLGTWATSAKAARSEYSSVYSTETLSEWVGKGSGTQAYPKTLNNLGYYD